MFLHVITFKTFYFLYCSLSSKQNKIISNQLILELFNKAFLTAQSTASKWWDNCEIWTQVQKEGNVTHSEALFQYLSQRTKENHEKPH